MSDCIIESKPFKDTDPIALETRSAGDPTLGSVATLRRAWLEKDLEAYVRLLKALAPQHDYSSRGLARALRISPRHLQRIFAATLGCAPQAWLNEQRLLAARQMLPTAGTVKEVAYSLGFHSASQLSRDFKGYFGFAPSKLLLEPATRSRPPAVLHDGAIEPAPASERKRPS